MRELVSGASGGRLRRIPSARKLQRYLDRVSGRFTVDRRMLVSLRFANTSAV